MRVAAGTSIMRLRGRILLLLAFSAFAILAPALAIWNLEQASKDALSRVMSFHDAIEDLSYEGLRVAGELRRGTAMPQPSDTREEWNRGQRYLFNQLLQCVGKITLLHQQIAWSDGEASVARLRKQVQALDAAIASGPFIDPPASHLPAIHLTLNQLRLLHRTSKTDKLEALERYRRDFWHIGAPAAAFFFLSAGSLGGVVWRGIHRSIDQELQLRAELTTNEERLREAQHIARVGSWELDSKTRHLHWSQEIFRIFEIDPSRFGASYEAFLNAIHPADRDIVNQAYTESLKTRRPYEITHRLLLPDGRIKWVQERCETDYSSSGDPIRSRGTVQDVTERVLSEKVLEASLREKTTLLQEIHHRVKNNLQVVSSMLFFEQRQASDPTVIAQFQRSRNRVSAISLVHESLYQMTDLSGIKFSDYVSSLGRQVIQEFSGTAGPVSLRTEGSGFSLGITEAVPAALIVNELLTNSLKHAFPHGKGGVISIRIEIAHDGTRHLHYSDDGVGSPAPANPAPDRSQSLGMRLVERLTEQIQATLVRETPPSGTAFHLSIPPTSAAPS